MPVDNLHPGVRVALARSRMDEAQVARAMAAGELASPQQYGNSWLFNLRITGTGASYREAHDEYVWRDPSLYLNQGFLDRCNGLPVILEHPNKEMLDSKEYHDRNIGSIMYPYIRGDEVWGIARIIDQPAARFMAEHRLSTSPAVVFTPKDGNEKIDTKDGKHLLIEGKPSLLDHLAICEEGVWDRGGPPAGIDVTGSHRSDAVAVIEKEHEEQEKNMAKQDRRGRHDEDVVEREEERERAKERERDREERADTDGDKIDRLLKGIEVLSDRMDAIEAAADRRGRHDNSRKDLDEEDREKGGEESHDKRDDRRGRHDTSRQDPDDDDREKGGERDDRRHRRDASRQDLDEEDREKGGEHSRDDRRGRKDTDPEKEERQAAELHDLAEEEEEEAEEQRGDRHHRDDSEIESHFKPWEEAVRKEGESDSAYSRRMDAWARKHDKNYAKRDDESIAAHCDRVDRAYRKDRARRDAQARLDAVPKLMSAFGKLMSRLDRLEARTQDRTDEDEVKFADAQARADAVYGAHGDHAPRPMRGENLVGYRIRLARGLQKHSPTWKESDLSAIARSDSVAFTNIEAHVYNDAMAAAQTPTAVPIGTLREIHKKMPYGGTMIEFQGEPLSWMQTFMLPAQGARITSKPGEHTVRH